MKLIREASFREIYHKLLYIKCPQIIKSFINSGAELNTNCTGVVAYGYIDEQCGISFQIFGTASMENGEINKEDNSSASLLIMRRGSIAECEYMDLNEAVYIEYDSRIKMIRDNYDTKNAVKEEMRKMSFLDSFRDDNYPDDVKVIIFSEGLQPEQVWMGCCDVTNEMLHGILLNEPNQDYGVHKGDKIGFVPIKKDDESLLLVAYIKR